MRFLILIHRWLGVAFCLLFAMWFATGMVMHFVPFPSLTEAERIAGLASIAPGPVRHGAAEAVQASGLADAARARLFARMDGAVYRVEGESGLRAVQARDLSPADVRDARLARDIAADHARRRGLDAAGAAFVEVAQHDQWSVPNGLDAHRPLYRIALDDVPGTELYVSSVTGEVVLDTTRLERVWNYAGSVLHWIYPTALRRDWKAWDTTVWWLSLVALITALAGAVVGVLRLKVGQGRDHRVGLNVAEGGDRTVSGAKPGDAQIDGDRIAHRRWAWASASPYRGLHAWHHWLGLGCATFVLTWTFSGWLSMDHGRLFSRGKPAAAEAAAVSNASLAAVLWSESLHRVPAQALEVEWFAFDGRLTRRERSGLATQRLSRAGDDSVPAQRRPRAGDASVSGQRRSGAGDDSMPEQRSPVGDASLSDRAYLQAGEVDALAPRLAPHCAPAVAVRADDAYRIVSSMPGAPVYRLVCGETWFHVDGANGAMLEKLDPSRRAYRWLYAALHTLDFPGLLARPQLRTIIVVLLCALGLAFSLTGVVIGWRRLRRDFPPSVT
jgi:hypothetical protein